MHCHCIDGNLNTTPTFIIIDNTCMSCEHIERSDVINFPSPGDNTIKHYYHTLTLGRWGMRCNIDMKYVQCIGGGNAGARCTHVLAPHPLPRLMDTHPAVSCWITFRTTPSSYHIIIRARDNLSLRCSLVVKRVLLAFLGRLAIKILFWL